MWPTSCSQRVIAADLRCPALAPPHPRPGADRTRDLADLSAPRRGHGRLRRRHPPRRERRRQRGPAEPVEAEGATRAAPSHVLEAARRRASSASSTRRRSGSTRTTAGREPRDEALPLCAPAHLYTATKLAGEIYCRATASSTASSTRSCASASLRPARPPRGGGPGLRAQGARGRAADDRRRGTQSRRFVYVEDLADGVVRALAPVAAGNRPTTSSAAEDMTIRRSPRRSATSSATSSSRSRPAAPATTPARP